MKILEHIFSRFDYGRPVSEMKLLARCPSRTKLKRAGLADAPLDREWWTTPKPWSFKAFLFSDESHFYHAGLLDRRSIFKLIGSLFGAKAGLSVCTVVYGKVGVFDLFLTRWLLSVTLVYKLWTGPGNDRHWRFRFHAFGRDLLTI